MCHCAVAATACGLLLLLSLRGELRDIVGDILNFLAPCPGARPCGGTPLAAVAVELNGAPDVKPLDV